MENKMGRTQLSPQRLSETKKLNIGRMIIFCEGKTEKYYFDYFAEILKKNKYTDVEVVLETANGNARTVLNFANAFMADDRNNRKYSTYGKYLAFEAGAGVGYLTAKYEEYLPLDGHYVYQQTSRTNWFGPVKLKFALVWNIGRWMEKGGRK